MISTGLSTSSFRWVQWVCVWTRDKKGKRRSEGGVLYLCTMPMSASCASLTGRPSTSRAPPLYGEAPQTHCICSVWPRKSVQFSTICWACTYAPQKGHRQLCLTRKNSNDTVRNYHDCCHHQHHLMRPDPLNVYAKPGMEMASGQWGYCCISWFHWWCRSADRPKEAETRPEQDVWCLVHCKRRFSHSSDRQSGTIALFTELAYL